MRRRSLPRATTRAPCCGHRCKWNATVAGASTFRMRGPVRRLRAESRRITFDVVAYVAHEALRSILPHRRGQGGEVSRQGVRLAARRTRDGGEAPLWAHRSASGRAQRCEAGACRGSRGLERGEREPKHSRTFTERERSVAVLASEDMRPRDGDAGRARGTPWPLRRRRISTLIATGCERWHRRYCKAGSALCRRP